MALQAVIGASGVGYNSGATVLSLEQRTIYNRNLLSRLLPNLVFLPYGQIRPMPANSGQTAQFRKFESLALPSAALVEGVTPNPSDLTMSSLSVTPEQWGDYVEISDVLDLTAPDPVLLEAGALLGEQAALLMDTKVRDVLAATTNVQYAAGRAARVNVASTDLLKTSEIQKAVRTMHSNKVSKITSMLDASTGIGTKPIPACFIGIIGPKALYDLKTESGGKFVPVHEYSSTMATLPFEVGAVDEVRFVMSHNTTVYAGAGASSIDVHATVILGRDAFGVISPVGIENIIKGFGAGDDPLNQRATSGWKAFFKAVILQSAAVLKIEHAVS